MNRRHFLQAASGLLVAASAGLVVPDRRFWSLDRTMVRQDFDLVRGDGPFRVWHLPGGERVVLPDYSMYTSIDDPARFYWLDREQMREVWSVPAEDLAVYRGLAAVLS